MTVVGPRAGRWLLFATVLGSGLVFLDGSAVNVALPHLGRDLNAPMAGLQWTINAYMLTLSALVLLGGALGDRYGRRLVFLIGTVWFAGASLLCALAGDVVVLALARALQGVGGALLTPGSLALIQASFPAGERARAIGIWSGFSGLAGVAGPLLGGWLVDVASWRWVFLINLPLAVLVVAVTLRHVPESRSEEGGGRFDVAGAALGALGLAGLTVCLIQAPEAGWGSPAVLLSGFGGLAAIAAFVRWERRTSSPMTPPLLFRSRRFTGANLATLCVYGALSGVSFFLVVELQVVAGFSALRAGLAMLPATVLLLLLSGASGALSQRIGPRLQMTVGPLVCAAGTLMLLRVGPGAGYWGHVLPAMTVFGFGLAATVAPLTATVLAAAPDRYAGIASGVNNAAARVAGLLAVAGLPALAGVAGLAYEHPVVFDQGFRVAILVCAGLLVLGGAISLATIGGRSEVV
ncbi:MFS transporter [Rhizohabitans arisaemae]|uniref:MFS transporter n=1 Tax=Rhizohabitans arisaemae TaxID=2720610 RepID=UPI0024B102F7|nr:MFS transporter [Rhizohabitans arisaemae]